MPQTFFLDRPSRWHALHPLTKSVVALALIATAFSVRWFFIPIALFLLVVLPLAVWAQIWRELIRTTFLVILPVAISLALVQGFFYPARQDVIFQIGPFALKSEGLEYAFVTSTRLMVVAGAGLLWSIAPIPPTWR